MALFWFLAGMLTTVAALIVLMQWLRRTPRFGALPALPWPAAVGAIAIIIVVLGLYRWLAHPERESQSAAPAARLTLPPAMGGGTAASSAGSGAGTSAGSMENAIASLEARLAKGGGSADDWELLAKSFEFLGRPEDAAKARARQLPAPPISAGGSTFAAESSTRTPRAAAASGSAPAAGTTVSGQLSLAATLRARAISGATLFIVAKSVDSPGAPVAVYRGSVSSWPVKFTLDDSQSMLPGRNLSTAGRVTVEARISQSGQAQPASGDLRGSSGAIDPANHQPLNIVIDQIVP